jgi:hypothetical protein
MLAKAGAQIAPNLTGRSVRRGPPLSLSLTIAGFLKPVSLAVRA